MRKVKYLQIIYHESHAQLMNCNRPVLYKFVHVRGWSCEVLPKGNKPIYEGLVSPFISKYFNINCSQ